MAKNVTGLFVPSAYSVWTAPFGTAAPTTPTATPGASWYEIGYIEQSGITEDRAINDNKIYDLVGSLLRNPRNQEERSFGFTALEDNRIIRELRYPASALTSGAGTSEVQTVTMTATGGTWGISGGYGGAGTATGLAQAITTSALQTALRALPGLSAVTVTGTAGTSYVITFPASIGNVNQLSLDVSALTGGSATITTTTPGVAPVNTRAVGAGTLQNLRAFLIYAADGVKQVLYSIPNGEMTQSGAVTLSGSSARGAQMTLTAYPDSASNFFYIIDNDPSQNTSVAFL